MSSLERAGEAPAPPLGPSRIAAIDFARGVALAAMAAYHFSWDLSFYQLIAVDVGTDPAWKWFARTIAGSFLFLVGLSLVLGHGNGVRWRPFLKRLAMIAGAAAAITVATYFAFPGSYIFFGILHCIALSSVLALPFLRAPLPLVLIAAAFVLAAPRLIGSDVFNAPILAWLGLGTRVPLTNDYVPIFPWFGLVLAGISAGRVLIPRVRQARLAGRRAKKTFGGALAWAGRHSLIIYLVHQPLLLAILYPLAQWLGPDPAVQAARFEAACVDTGYRREACRRVWACFAAELQSNGSWSRALRDQLTPEERQTMAAISRACFARETKGS
jgi:uncharacterized membrane protein